MSDALTLKAAADALGVHYMTAYRYVRLGMLPAEKRGSEWRILAADLEAFRDGNGKSAAPRIRRRADWTSRLEARMMAGDEAGSWAVVEAAMAAGLTPSSVYVDVLGPALRSIGRRWEAGTVDVADEHRASAVAARIVGRLGPRFARRGRSRGAVVAGTPPLELHGLPLALVTDHLRGAGYTVIDLGCNVPVASLAKTVREANRLVAVVLSVTTPGRDDDVTEAILAARIEADVPVFVGGGAIEGPDHAAHLGADAWAADALGAVRLVEEAYLSPA